MLFYGKNGFRGIGGLFRSVRFQVMLRMRRKISLGWRKA